MGCDALNDPCRPPMADRGVPSQNPSFTFHDAIVTDGTRFGRPTAWTLVDTDTVLAGEQRTRAAAAVAAAEQAASRVRALARELADRARAVPAANAALTDPRVVATRPG
jgi:hypothetical protein